MSLTRYEQETVILFNEEEKMASVYTYSGKLKRRLQALCADRSGDAKQIEDDGRGGLTFEIPKRWVKVNPTRILSEAQKEAISKMRGKQGT